MHKTRADLGAIAQLGERLLCKQEVVGSIPSGSTKSSQIASGNKDQSAMLWLRLCLLFVCTFVFKKSAINEHFNPADEFLQMIGLQQRFQFLHLLVQCFSDYGSTLSEYGRM